MDMRDVNRQSSFRGQRGSIMLLTTLAITVLMGIVGLAIDGGALYHHRRIMQTAADAGALAGGSEIKRGQTSRVQASALAATATNRFTNGSSGVSVTVNHPPSSGFYAGNAQFVEVLITQPSPTYFMRVFGWNTVPVPARAVAGVGANGRNCVYVLEPSQPSALQAASNASMDADCGIIVNSNHHNAMTASSSATVEATSVSIAGGYQLNGGSITPTPDVGVPPEPDPLAYLQPPSYGGCTVNNFHENGGTHTLSPGVYCRGITANGAHLTLLPGLYVIQGGGIDLQATAVLEGDGVTIYLTEGAGMPFGPLSFQSDSQVRLTAPTTGPYAGILFYQDPNAGNSNTTHHMESSTNSYYEGALYFPTHQIQLHSNSTVDADYTLIVANMVSFTSSASFDIRSDYSGLPGGSPIKRLSLVE
jgi:Flp pilus assembly protein TadG